MPTPTLTDLVALLEKMQSQMADMSKRIGALEHTSNGAAPPQPAPPRPVSAPPAVAAPPCDAPLSDEEVLAISAAIGAYLGVRAHIRQIRLVSSSAWAQQGRVSIQASHTLQG